MTVTTVRADVALEHAAWQAEALVSHAKYYGVAALGSVRVATMRGDWWVTGPSRQVHTCASEAAATLVVARLLGGER